MISIALADMTEYQGNLFIASPAEKSIRRINLKDYKILA
jgi:hypothetical protein